MRNKYKVPELIFVWNMFFMVLGSKMWSQRIAETATQNARVNETAGKLKVHGKRPGFRNFSNFDLTIVNVIEKDILVPVLIFVWNYFFMILGPKMWSQRISETATQTARHWRQRICGKIKGPWKTPWFLKFFKVWHYKRKCFRKRYIGPRAHIFLKYVFRVKMTKIVISANREKANSSTQKSAPRRSRKA